MLVVFELGREVDERSNTTDVACWASGVCGLGYCCLEGWNRAEERWPGESGVGGGGGEVEFLQQH